MTTFCPIPNIVVTISDAYCISILRFCVRLGGKATLSEGNSFLKRPPPPSDIRLSSFEEEEGEREDGEGDGRRQHRSISLSPSLLSRVFFSYSILLRILGRRIDPNLLRPRVRSPRSNPPPSLRSPAPSECLHPLHPVLPLSPSLPPAGR